MVGDRFSSFSLGDIMIIFNIEKQLRDAAAAEVMLQLGSSHEVDDDDGKSSNRKRKHLNPDEKVKQSRDRNREHAKNTRLRKKAYVTKLKELVDQMTRQKENEERDRRVLSEKIHDTVSSAFDPSKNNS